MSAVGVNAPSSIGRFILFAALGVAVSFVYTNAWIQLAYWVALLSAFAWSLRELCIVLIAAATAWLVKRYARLWPLFLCGFAGALPVLVVWLSARRSAVWQEITPYLRWSVLEPFVVAAVALPVAFILLGLRWRDASAR